MIKKAGATSLTNHHKNAIRRKEVSSNAGIQSRCLYYNRR